MTSVRAWQPHNLKYSAGTEDKMNVIKERISASISDVASVEVNKISGECPEAGCSMEQ